MQIGIKTITGIILFTILLAFRQQCTAQNTSGLLYPSAILVQLNSEHNRIEALTRSRQYKKLEEVKQDAAEVIKRFKLDFHDHFNYCTVYYYMDTNIALIKKKMFDGILMDSDGLMVKKPVINSKNEDYFIAFYGYPVSQPSNSEIQTDTSLYQYDPQQPFGRGLVILNDKFLQVTYYYKLGLDEIGLGKNKSIKKYSYRSRNFEIEYYPFAYLFNKNLKERSNRRHLHINPEDPK
jgi:hypothetical protein